MKAVAPRDEIACESFGLAVVLEMNLRVAIEIADADGFGLEEDFASGCYARRDQILDDFVLRVDGDGLAAGQIFEVDAMACATEAQLDAVVRQAFTLQSRTDTGSIIRSAVPFSNTPARTRCSIYS